MKTIKKALCVVLSVIMVFGCFSMTGFAAENPQFTYSLRYKSERPDSYNADMVLDMLDEILAEEDIYEEIKITDNIVFEIDLRSVNGLCSTLDEFEDLLDNLLIQAAIAIALGDLKELDFDTWKTGMKRGSQDITILKELIEFLNANGYVISKICDGTLNLGVLKNEVDIKELLGEDGVSGLIKELLIDIVYDGKDVDTNYAKYKDDIDSYIYGDLIGKFADDYLPGFKLDQNSKVKDLICLAAGLVIDTYLIPALEDINIDLANEESEELKALAPWVNLKGSTYNFSGVTVKNNGDFLSQANDIAGAVFSQIIPGYQWKTGSWDMINDNVEGALKYLGVNSGLIPEADSMTFDKIFMEVISIITRNVDLGVYGEGLGECDSLEEVVAVLLMNIAYEEKLNVNYKGDESWEVVAGDLLAGYMYGKFDITDYNGKPYREGGGKDVFEVANYVMNYFIFDKNTAAIAGFSTTKQESVFTKLDKILDYFGENKSVAFETEKFIKGTSGQKGLIDAIFDLDIEEVIRMTAVKAINAAGNVSAVEFIYKTVQYGVNNWAGGKTIFPAYQNKAFTNALSNQNIAKLVKELLTVLNSRKESIVPFALFTAALVMDEEETAVDITEASISDFKATGNRATPTATVKAGDKTLTQGVDFDVITHNKDLGTASATIKGIGLYEGEFDMNYNIIFDDMGDVKVASQSTKSIKFTWDKVAYADKYNVYYIKGGVYTYIKSVTTNSVTVAGLKPGTKYTFKIEPENAVYGKSAATEIKTVTKPDAVSASTIKYTSTDSSVTLTWTKAAGAISYKVDQYIDGNWKEVTAVAKTTATITGLKGNQDYKFRVRSYTRDHDKAIVLGSASAAVTAKTKLGATTLKVASASATSLKLSWSKVDNATGYQVYQYVSGAWKRIKVTTATSLTVSSLKANTKYYFKVRAYAKATSGYVYGPYTQLNPYTNLAKTASAKVSKTTATAATLSWSKVSGAQGYQVWMYTDGKWVRKTNTTSTTATISGLKSGSKTYFRIRAYKKSGSSYIYGDYTSNVTALTLPAAVTGLNVKSSDRKNTSIKLTWTKTTGASGYQVYRYSGGKWVKVATTTSTYYTNTGLKKNTEYKYKVRAYQKVGSTTKYGAYSSVYTVRTRLF